MSANQYAIDALTRHQLYLQRYSGGMVKRLLPYLDSMSKDIASRLRAEDLTEFQFARLSAMQVDINQAITAAIGKVGDDLNGELAGLVEYEAGFTGRLLDGMVKVDTSTASVEALIGSLSTKPMELVNGRNITRVTIDQAIRQFSRTISRDVGATIRQGIAQGGTTREIVNNVSRMVSTRTKAQAEALIRTAANHSGNIARSAVYHENADILDGEIFTATLDGRTTIECASNDGKRFAVGEGPQPALHYNCRSVRVPDVNPEFTLAKLSGTRSSVDGPVKNKTFGGWLRDQPADFQDEYFSQYPDGKQRAKLFRNGGLSIEKFTDNNSIVYTLDELRRLEPQAFERANL